MHEECTCDTEMLETICPFKAELVGYEEGSPEDVKSEAMCSCCSYCQTQCAESS